ncbi:MAG: LemA family protein [Candidatus ainarchaeum sp.]|nr:LemA family protein [Candidatus ainarchaeum sp.]
MELDLGLIIPIIVGIIALVIIYVLAKNWVKIYNKFQYWINRAERKFADLDILMQERLDRLQALADIVKKYDIHEYKTLKDVIEARTGWTKDTSLNEKVKQANKIENAFIKIQAVFEKYPNLKADKLHKRLMKNDERVERRLREARLGYNRVAQQYNERVVRFPRLIVAKFHGFKKMDYLKLSNSINQESHEQFDPKKLFEN